MSYDTVKISQKDRKGEKENSDKTQSARLFYFVLIVLMYAPCIHAYAECHTDDIDLRRTYLVHEDMPGIWFSEAVANCILRDLSELRLQRVRVTTLEERMLRSTETIDILRRANTLGDEALDHANDSIERALEAQRLAEDRLHVWWRAPSLWVLIGSIITLGLVALSIYAIYALQPK